MSASIHGDFRLLNGEPSLSYVLSKNQSSIGTFTDGSVATGWLIKKVVADQGNTNGESVQGVSILWDFRGQPNNRPNYIAVIAGYEMPTGVKLSTKVNDVDTPVVYTSGHDALFYIALVDTTRTDPDNASGPWPAITITVDIDAASFNNADVINDPAAWKLYYLSSTQELVAGPILSVEERGIQNGNIYTIVTPENGDVSGRYIFAQV